MKGLTELFVDAIGGSDSAGVAARCRRQPHALQRRPFGPGGIAGSGTGLSCRAAGGDRPALLGGRRDRPADGALPHAVPPAGRAHRPPQRLGALRRGGQRRHGHGRRPQSLPRSGRRVRAVDRRPQGTGARRRAPLAGGGELRGALARAADRGDRAGAGRRRGGEAAVGTTHVVDVSGPIPCSAAARQIRSAS